MSINNMPATLADIQKKYGESVYPLYKDEMHEPYMETVNGFGYEGVLLYDELEDKVQCSYCGRWFSSLGKHINSAHQQTADEYRDEHGLYKQVGLCSKGFSQSRSKTAGKYLRKYSFTKNDERVTGKKQKPRHKSKRISNMKKAKQVKVQFKNKHGLCDAQIASRLVVVRDTVGKDRIEDITSRELSRNDINLYQAIRNRYGTFKNACYQLGIEYIGRNKYSDSEMIAGLRKFVKHNKRIPMASEAKFKNKRSVYLRPYDTYVNHFGSWRRAKMMAGLDQLLKEVKAQ